MTDDQSRQNQTGADLAAAARALSLAPPPIAAGDERVASLMDGYPGPVLVVVAVGPGPEIRDARVELVTANRAGGALLFDDRSWWPQLTPWLLAVATGESAPLSVRVSRPLRPEVVEWRAVALPSGRWLLLGTDVTLERWLRQSLTESRQRYKDLVEISSDFAWEVGGDGRFVFVSPRGALGFAAADLLERRPEEVLLEDGDEGGNPFLSHRPIERLELWLRAAGNQDALVEISVMPLWAEDGTWAGARGVCRDLTEQALRTAELSRIRHREQVITHILQVQRQEVDADKALEATADAVQQAFDADGCRIFGRQGAGDLNDAQTRPHPARLLLVASRGETVLPEPAEALVSDLLGRCLALGGPQFMVDEELAVLVCHTAYRDDVNGAVCLWRRLERFPNGVTWDEDDLALLDGIAERVGMSHAHRTHQERLRHLSERDGLTALFNRRTFLERLGEALRWHDRGRSVLMYIDLDNFKAVNDVRGHQQGDAVLQAVGQLVAGSCRPGDLPGRLGGDEFVLWLSRSDATLATAVMERLFVGIADLRSMSGAENKPLGFSIGLAEYAPGSGESVKSLLARADAAMYEAKSHGKGGYAIAPALSVPQPDAPLPLTPPNL